MLVATLRNFMQTISCGLINKSNPCRCAKKTRGFIQEGYVDPDNLLFARGRMREVREAALKVFETLKTLDDKCAEIYRRHPLYKPPDMQTQPFRQLIQGPISKVRTGCLSRDPSGSNCLMADWRIDHDEQLSLFRICRRVQR